MPQMPPKMEFLTRRTAQRGSLLGCLQGLRGVPKVTTYVLYFVVYVEYSGAQVKKYAILARADLEENFRGEGTS